MLDSLLIVGIFKGQAHCFSQRLDPILGLIIANMETLMYATCSRLLMEEFLSFMTWRYDSTTIVKKKKSYIIMSMYPIFSYLHMI